MKSKIAFLVAVAVILVAFAAYGQQTCEEQCSTVCAIASQEMCDNCIEACTPPPGRVSPVGPRRQPGVNYVLDKTIGLTVLNYKNPQFPGWFNIGREISELGFGSAQFWITEPPYCMGHWELPYPSNMFITDDPGCEMENIFTHGGLNQIFLKPSSPSWTIVEAGCPILDTTPQAFMVYRLYEMAWWRDITVVFTRWEQDWFPEGCPHGTQHEDPATQEARLEWLIQYESRQQQQFETARKAMMQRYPHAKLTVLRSMTVNHFPGYNVDEDHPTVAEAIGRMVEDPDLYEPDLIGISYWKRRMDPIPALDWVESVTRYPRTRMFMVEFGARTKEQPMRYEEYIPLFWEWGIRTVLIWVYQDTWTDKYGVTPSSIETLLNLMGDNK